MGNRQGGKMTPRQDLSYQHKPRNRTRKVDGSNVDMDPLLPEFHAAMFRCAGTVDTTSPISAPHTLGLNERTFHSNPNFVSKIVQEEKHVMSCVPHDQDPMYVRDEFTTADDEDTSDVAYSHRAFHSPSASGRDVLKPSTLQNHQDLPKGEFTVSNIFCDSYFSASFPKHGCLEADPLARFDADVNSSTTRLAAACIEKLEHLKRNIEQCNTENVTHFNNAGFAQLQCEAGYDDYDNAADYAKVSDTCMHERNNSMSPNTAVNTDVPHLDDKNKSKAVRKLSEPGQFVVRKDSMSSKSIIPGAWSKSAENSPVIVRKALPRPGSPLIVQRTPSQSPSVERRFPANAPPSSMVPGHGAESLDSPKPRQHVFQQLLSRDTSLSIRQKATAEISIPHVSNSPISVRKMPESPILFSFGTHHQEKGRGRELTSNTTKDDRSVPDLIPVEKTYKVQCMKALTLSSYSSSSSESPQQNVPWQEESVPPPIPLCTSSTSSSSVTMGSGSPTPITFCPQPKGTPIRTCTMVSQPSTAVVLASRESQESLQTVNVGTPPVGGREMGSQDGKDTQTSPTSSHKQPSSSAVTEDTIKENSQSAVFGSVSPKLLRHRRLIKDNPNPPHNQHTFPKQSQSISIVTAKGDNTVLWSDDSACSDSCEHVHKNGVEMLVQLSHSAPSAFSSHASDTVASCAGNKTLGQRIREVINEATTGANVTRETSSILVRTYTKVFSKDDIFTSSSTPDKSSGYCLSNNSTNKSRRLVYDKKLPLREANRTDLTRETADDCRIKLTFSRANTKETIEDSHLPKSTGHSYYLNSSRDSCSSCVSDSSQVDFYDSPCFHSEIAELTQANLCHQTELLSGGMRGSRQQVVERTRLSVQGGQGLVTSDTSDTLSTDRDTSGSSKRESSTSTATDDTLTSFQTRSTADSADYEEGFVLPESLIFIRSADKDSQNDLCGGFESEQTTIKRKLVRGQLHDLRTEHEPLFHKTRKKRRKQVNVQSQIITARRQHADGTLTRNGTVRQVHSDVISDDSDLFGSRDDISDLLTSRDDISDLPSSRDDISDLPSSRDDISDLPSSRDDISDLPSSRDDISDLPSSRDDISDLPSSRDDISNLHSSRDDCPRSKSSTTGGLNAVRGLPDCGAINRRVFHRSDLQSSAHPKDGPADKSRPIIRKPPTDHHTSTDSDTHSTFNRRGSSSQDSCGSFLDVSQMSGDVAGPGTVLPHPHHQDGQRTEAIRPDVLLPAHSHPCDTRRRPTAASHAKTTLEEHAEDRRQHAQDTSVSTDEGKQLLLQYPHSPESENAVVLSYTIYNSACHGVHACD